MWIVDTRLKAREEQGRPIRVGIVGAGFMCQGLTNQIVNSVPGMRVVGDLQPASRERASDKYSLRRTAMTSIVADTQAQVRRRRQRRAARRDRRRDAAAPRSAAYRRARRRHRSVEFGAHVVLEAFRHGKDVVLMNAELDAHHRSDPSDLCRPARRNSYGLRGRRAGRTDELYRWVKGLGLTPRVIGNVKGLQDPYRKPTTQKGFAERWGQNPAMVTSFADGSKISFEQAIVANATGFKVRRAACRAAWNTTATHEDRRALRHRRAAEAGRHHRLCGRHAADQGLRAWPSIPTPSSSTTSTCTRWVTGPLYSFFMPYHLVHFEVPNAIARVVLFRDPVAKPLAARWSRCAPSRSAI